MSSVSEAFGGTSATSTSYVWQTTAVVVIIYVVYKIVIYLTNFIRKQRMFADLPGPKKLGILRGSFCVMTADPEQRLQQFIDWCNRYGSEKGFIRLYGSFLQPMLVACHPYSMRKILKTAEPKPKDLTSGYRTLEAWLGDGLLISGGDKWARNRRLLTPAFHFDILKPYIDVYNGSASVFSEKLARFADEKKTFELFQNVCQCTLDIILRCAFSYETEVQTTSETHPYAVAVSELTATNAERLRSPLTIPDTTFYMTEAGKKFRRNCNYVHSVAEDIINKRRETLAQNEGLKNRKYLDFLDILLTAKDEKGVGLTDLDIRNEVDTFLFEGHDTTASAISWILYSLAEHPEYQRKCQEEIDDVLAGREADDIEWSDLPKFEYLTMCIKEGMRLHCPVAIVQRMTTKDFELGGTVYPPGTSVMINIWMLHHNEEVWGKDHWEFKPERFTKENCAKMDPFQYVPFSGGPRNCIGQSFAMNEEKVVLAKLLRGFHFHLDLGHKVKKRLAAVMRPDTDIKMTVERRIH